MEDMYQVLTAVVGNTNANELSGVLDTEWRFFLKSVLTCLCEFNYNVQRFKGVVHTVRCVMHNVITLDTAGMHTEIRTRLLSHCFDAVGVSFLLVYFFVNDI